ncbi:TetR/AcrR family transcriptional regulator [Paenibacillus sp. ACRRX]|nr:TetR/AcrR family transcriptional regulator [Paenibacillus sp. ACRRX]
MEINDMYGGVQKRNGSDMPKIVVTKEEWIEKGIGNFAVGGADALLIEKMARELGCSKSSFYWYFGDREQFIRCLVDEWVRRATYEVMQCSLMEQSVDARIKVLLTSMFSTHTGKDFVYYLRRMGQENFQYRDLLEKVENDRIDFMTSLLVERGFPQEKAISLATVIYHFYLGWYERNKYLGPTANADQLTALLWEYVIQTEGGIE